jgi:3-oxoacyl-[acyl-carrier-protein] synthase II
MRRVVITGMGAITPIGNTVEAFGKALLKGTNGVGPITRFNTDKYKTRFACEVKDFNALDYMEKNEQRKNDPYAQFALAAATQAIDQSMPGLKGINLNRVGVIIGAANGGPQIYEQQIKEFALGDGTPRFHPFFIPMMMANAAPGIISIRYGFKGMNYSTVAACASSNIAMVDAMNKIRYGQADVMITGGAEASISEGAVGGFIAMKALSTNNENAATASRPFDVARDGFVIGEGAVVFVLEAEEHALKRGATILAEVAGGSVTSDAHHIAAPHPQGEGATSAIQLALEDAGMEAGEIDYLSAHATSTPAGDMSEIIAIRKVFGDAPGQLKISAGKSAFGHLLGAAGAIGVLTGLQAMAAQMVPPTINTVNIDPLIPATLPIVTGKSVPHSINTIMCNSFGFGGHNAIVICKRYE